jgi:hypothetical protein
MQLRTGSRLRIASRLRTGRLQSFVGLQPLFSALVVGALALVCTGSTHAAGVDGNAVAQVALDSSNVLASAASARESDAAVIATGVATTTGLAISPLLVLVALGWYDFLQAGGFDAATDSLPLHAHPWLLIPLTSVLVLVLAKKFVSPVIPLPIRKVLDSAEYLEAKFSALVAAGILLPTIVGAMAAATGGDDASVVQTASLLPDSAVTIVLFVVMFLLFVSVWITFHVIDALIVLSPFAIVDTALVALRGSILAVLALALLVSPFFALALAIPLIVASIFFAGWCVRLDVFALTTAFDLLLARRGDAYRPVRAFLAARSSGAPIRTMGHAVPSARGIRFTYRPWFVLPKRTIDLESSRPVLVCGAIWATLRDDARNRGVIALPPRYNRVAADVATAFGAVPRDGLIRRGWRDFRAFLGSIFGRPISPDIDARAATGG